MGLRIAFVALALISFVAGDSDKELIDLFLAATPLHPGIRTPGVTPQANTPPKLTTNELYNSAFVPLMECSGNKTDLKLGDFGVITSPNYPRNYPARMSCEWMIEGPSGSKIRAVLVDSYTQAWFFAYYDYIMVARNGNFSTVDRLSGDMNSKTPMIIESEENRLGLRFRSSALFNFRGFKLQYLVIPADDSVPYMETPVFDGICGTTLVRPEVSSTVAPSSTDGTSTPGPVPAPEPIDPGEGGEFPVLIPPADANITTTFARAGIANEHIVGGGEALRHAYPWMAALLIDNKHFCGGSVIDDQHIMTAAHCTDRANMVTVLLGTHNLKAKEGEDGRKVYNITRDNIFQHPEYNGNTITYDISILRLPEKIQFTDRIKPVCLPNRHYINKFYDDMDTRVSGWGKPADNAAGVSPYLKEADVKVLPNNLCRVAFRGIVTGNLICVKTTTTASPCKGDSGGPLMIKQAGNGGTEYLMQLGIVSFGSLTCEKAYPVGFTRVTAFLDYINEITGKNY